MQLQERRQQRSNRPGEAIQLLLEHTLRNFQLDAIALLRSSTEPVKAARLVWRLCA